MTTQLKGWSKAQTRQVTKGDVQIVNKHMKRSSTSSSGKGKSKTTVIYHYIASKRDTFIRAANTNHW